MRYAYPIALQDDADGVTITSPDVPEMITCGRSRAEAIARVPDALVSALCFYTDEGRKLPIPSDDGFSVAVPALTAAKLALHDAMIEHRITNVELGRRLGQSETLIRRLRDPLHRSHIDQVEAALRVLGLQVVADITEVVPVSSEARSCRRL